MPKSFREEYKYYEAEFELEKMDANNTYWGLGLFERDSNKGEVKPFNQYLERELDMINSFKLFETKNNEAGTPIECTERKLVCKFRFCSFAERVKMEYNKRILESVKAANPGETYNSYVRNPEQFEHFHNPCGTHEEMIPAIIECNFECKLTPSIIASGVTYEFAGTQG